MARLSLWLQVFCIFFPWRLRRYILIKFLKWKIHETAKIGFSILEVLKLEMGERSRIGHLTYARNISLIKLESGASLGNKNWISGYPTHSQKAFIDSDRDPSLLIKKEAAVTHSHRLDCTDGIIIGEFSTVAGWGTQFITHAIDVREARQKCSPIVIGKYCFIGSRCIILKGTELPNYCILGAGSVLSHKFQEEYGLYSGIPADLKKNLDNNLQYFLRESGPCL